MVVSRVPEIAPEVADLLSDGGDPVLIKREFPNVVDAMLDELRSIQERLATGATAPVADAVTVALFASSTKEIDNDEDREKCPNADCSKGN